MRREVDRIVLRDFFRLDDDHPFTGRHMLAVVLLFFGTIIAVNVVLAVAATGTFPGLVVENSYVASQKFNERLANDRAEKAAGRRLELGAPGGILDLRLASRDGSAERHLTVTALAGRPSSTREDRLIDLVETPDGYRAAEALPAGQWDVDIEGRRGGELIFHSRQRLYVRGE
jgi:nitrogen fixation protein FixH